MYQQQSHQRAFTAYRAAAESHPPARQIVMLHDGAIWHLQAARRAVDEARIEDRFRHVMKAHAVIGALQGCLDLERGGEIARLLDRLYGYLLHRLTLINLRNDPTICDEAAALLGRMRASWALLAGGTADATAWPAPAALEVSRDAPASTTGVTA